MSVLKTARSCTFLPGGRVAIRGRVDFNILDFTTHGHIAGFMGQPPDGYKRTVSVGTGCVEWTDEAMVWNVSVPSVPDEDGMADQPIVVG